LMTWRQTPYVWCHIYIYLFIYFLNLAGFFGFFISNFVSFFSLFHSLSCDSLLSGFLHFVSISMYQ
jgi:hypothetical protein